MNLKLPAIMALLLASSPFLQKTQTAEAANQTQPAKVEHAYFAGGCFWKTQFIFSKAPGVVKTRVGYTGGTTANPSYEQVCSHKTGHAEAVQVDFDPTKTSYRKLLGVFFDNHDPTTLNRQGPDIGTNYRSAIFYATPQQKDEAQKFVDELNRAHRFRSAVTTQIAPLTKFYDAEEYHQDYYAKNGAVCF